MPKSELCDPSAPSPNDGTLIARPSGAQVITFAGTHSQGSLQLNANPVVALVIDGTSYEPGDYAVTSSLAYNRDAVSGTLTATSVDEFSGCGNLTLVLDHNLSSVTRDR